MEPALDVIHRALHGEQSARAFLERTTSIYLLDAMDKSNPKTYGCWNFIHQALNEVERFEGHHSRSVSEPSPLVGHVRLLATMALKVARRSPDRDRSLIMTCISNASEYHGDASQSDWLIQVNVELREIVMGRIAAMAFDFKFHRDAVSGGGSSFADKVVLDTFCAILSANAVASGPVALNQFFTEWILPSAQSIPALALEAVVLHLAAEGMRKTRPAGTKDALQQLSFLAVSVVLGPLLFDSVSENSSNVDRANIGQEAKCQLVGLGLTAMRRWCDATDLSLPQIKHICAKVGIDIVTILNDAMYSDSAFVVDALAELVENHVRLNDPRASSSGRMAQVRHIIQVDEESFRSNFSVEQLRNIEFKEMDGIVHELMSAIGLQRFRFVERQKKGDHDVCRNLARIAASVCSARVQAGISAEARERGHGSVDLLIKAAAHPSVNISGIALLSLSEMVICVPELGRDLLPLLQRRAIVPHHFSSGMISLSASDLCGVNYHDFEAFRGSVLVDVLKACFRTTAETFMDSCSSAVEEFCAENSSIEVSLHLEAAIFCIESVADDVMTIGKGHFGSQLNRCFAALATRPSSLTSNPLTLARVCTLVGQYSRWCAQADCIGGASDLVMSAFTVSATSNPQEGCNKAIVEESSISSISEACRSLKLLLQTSPTVFLSHEAVSSLVGLWQSSVEARERGHTIDAEDRMALVEGFCVVVKSVEDSKQQAELVEALLSPLCHAVVRNLASADQFNRGKRDEHLDRAADDLVVASALVRKVTDRALGTASDIPADLMAFLRPLWPPIAAAAATSCDCEEFSVGVATFLGDVLPRAAVTETATPKIRDLFETLKTTLASVSDHGHHFESVCSLFEVFVSHHGKTCERKATGEASILEGEVVSMFEDTFLTSIEAIRPVMGRIWNEPAEQGRGGEDATESKSPQSVEMDSPPMECMCGLFNLLTKMVEICPRFLVTLPIDRSAEDSNEKLFRRAIESACSCCAESDTQAVASALDFLHVTVIRAETLDEDIKTFVYDSVMHTLPSTMSFTLQGCCSKYERSLVPKVAQLLHPLLRLASWDEMQSYLVSSLKQDFFLLGDNAKNTTLTFLGQCRNRVVSVDSLTEFLQDLWELHQAEEPESLPPSDVVAQFVATHGS